MNGLVPGQSFCHQPKQNGLHWICVAERHLVLDDHMGRCVEIRVRKSNLRAPMIFLHCLDAFEFIEFEPSIRINMLVEYCRDIARPNTKSKPSCSNPLV